MWSLLYIVHKENLHIHIPEAGGWPKFLEVSVKIQALPGASVRGNSSQNREELETWVQILTLQLTT